MRSRSDERSSLFSSRSTAPRTSEAASSFVALQQPHQLRVRQRVEKVNPRGLRFRRHEPRTEHGHYRQAGFTREATAGFVENLRGVATIAEQAAAARADQDVTAALDSEMFLQRARSGLIDRVVQHFEELDAATRHEAQLQPLPGPEIPAEDPWLGDPVLVHSPHAAQPETLAARGRARTHEHHARPEFLRPGVLRNAPRTVEDHHIRALVLDGVDHRSSLVGR